MAFEYEDTRIHVCLNDCEFSSYSTNAARLHEDRTGHDTFEISERRKD